MKTPSTRGRLVLALIGLNVALVLSAIASPLQAQKELLYGQCGSCLNDYGTTQPCCQAHGPCDSKTQTGCCWNQGGCL